MSESKTINGIVNNLFRSVNVKICDISCLKPGDSKDVFGEVLTHVTMPLGRIKGIFKDNFNAALYEVLYNRCTSRE